MNYFNLTSDFEFEYEIYVKLNIWSKNFIMYNAKDIHMRNCCVTWHYVILFGR